jgi:hypothetical protein
MNDDEAVVLDKKWVFKSIAVILGFVIAGVWFYWYMGMFSTLIVTEQSVGPFTYAYEECIGPYHTTTSIFNRVKNFLSSYKVSAGNYIAVFLDDPAQVLSNKLRSNYGIIIEEYDPSKLSAIQLQLKVANFEQSPCIVVEFPLKNSLSSMLAPMKVNPVIYKYITDKGYEHRESYEIYDLQKKTIIFAVPISQ